MTTTSIPLQLREVSLVAEAAGSPEAPPVVLLHGGGQTRHAWHWAVTELAQEGFYALAYDMRGHGDSTWAPTGTTRWIGSVMTSPVSSMPYQGRPLSSVRR